VTGDECRDGRWSAVVGRGWPPGRAAGGVRGSAALVWLAFILFPLVDAVGNGGPAFAHVLAILGATVFVAAYVVLVVTWRRGPPTALPWALFAVLIVTASALTLGSRPGWAFLFTYCAACAALVFPSPVGFLGVMLCAVLAVAESTLAGGASGAAIGFGASTLGIGLLMVLMRDLRTRNDELNDARAELARLAVAQERQRFARDLHDLLGHTLSVIALKAELAGRLLPHDPAAAGREVGEVEQVARQALGEVRQAVSGYWQPTLDGELEGARMALSAAGITADVQRSEVALDPEVEAVLAWAVREGATNVIRHSGARRCLIEIGTSGPEAAVEVLDDGHGTAPRDDYAGHGLAGLSERAESLRGTVEVGSRPEGGFRLAVTVPFAAP
jgi:two-component system sensor histidine kinase DesK